MQGIAVLDAGGQYCHLLARRVRQAHVLSHVCPIDVDPNTLNGVSGIIISGGPRSVTEPNAPTIDRSLLSLGVPILGICYGHQLLASVLKGGSVKQSYSREYGVSSLRLARSNMNSILSDVEAISPVWMSHGDSVEQLPDGFEVLASTDECRVAVMADAKRNIFGVQFHPEVSHTEEGQKILDNFINKICSAKPYWHPTSEETIKELHAEIQLGVGNRSVLFFVSGGVDSSVAYKLCADALGESRLRGVYVDTGFMRKGESDSVMTTYQAAGFHNIEKIDASHDFYEAVGNEIDPEEKRKRIGAAFLSVESRVLRELNPNEWVLGQGTIYPDTIESGGTANSAHIKTHHNRVPELLERVKAGDVIEPLARFYKDEVRNIGTTLGLPSALVQKEPFPGPGLAVRYLGAAESAGWREIPGLRDLGSAFQYETFGLPIRAVGVQGDERSYSYVAVIVGEYDEVRVSAVSRAITNSIADVNRVAFWISGKGPVSEFEVSKTSLTKDGLTLLQEADAIVRDEIAQFAGGKKIWQCPVVLLPLRRKGLGTIAIRPVESNDGMTARYSKLPIPVQQRLANRLLALSGVDAVLYDVTNKPPATIEWE